jgi:hypothetical protein
MPSSKGELTDPELREKIKEEVKSEEKGTLYLDLVGGGNGKRRRVDWWIGGKGNAIDSDASADDRRPVRVGGGKGSWSTWKAGEMARRYEKAGGGYKDTGENRNKAVKGEPVRKEEGK